MANRFASFRTHPEIATTFWIGISLILLGGIFVLLGWPYRAAVASGIGGSLAAAALVSALSPLNQEAFQEFCALGIKRSYFHRTKIDDDQWCKWLRGARQHCTLLGIAHHRWCEDRNFPEALRDCLNRGVHVKFLFLDPTSEVAKQRAKEDTRAARNTIQAIFDSIGFIWVQRKELSANARSNLTLYVYEATPSSGTTWIDNFMIVTHYLAGFPNVTSPALLIEPVTTDPGAQSLFDIYMGNVNRLMDQKPAPNARFSKIVDDNWIRENMPAEWIQRNL